MTPGSWPQEARRTGAGDQEAIRPSATARGGWSDARSAIQIWLGPSTARPGQPAKTSRRESGDQTAVVGAYWSKNDSVAAEGPLGTKAATRRAVPGPSATYQTSSRSTGSTPIQARRLPSGD